MQEHSSQHEYETLSSRVGWVALPERTQIVVTGRDRVSFLHNLSTAHIKALQPGGGCEAFLTSVQGKIIGYTFLFARSDSLILDTVPGQGDTLLSHMDRYLIREEVQLEERTSGWSVVLICGDEAPRWIGEQLGLLAPQGMLEHVEGEVAGSPVSVRRVPWSIRPSFFLCCEASQDEVLRQRLQDAHMPQCSQAAADLLRIEAGLPHYGRDILPDNLPQEVDRDQQAISFVKGCYLGQETVARIDALGHVNKKLVGLRWHGEQIPAVGMELSSGDKAVGQVTSAAWSHRLTAPIALGYVRRGHNGPGTELQSACGPVTVQRLPLS